MAAQPVDSACAERINGSLSSSWSFYWLGLGLIKWRIYV